MNPLLLIPLLVMLSAAAIIDARHRRIPNWLNLGIALSGFLATIAWPEPLVTPLMAFAGLLAGIALNLPLFLLCVRGGGDLKLFAAVGVWLGPWNTLLLFIGSTLVALVLALAQAACSGRLAALLSNTSRVAVAIAHQREAGLAHLSDGQGNLLSVDRPLPYAVAVLGALVGMLLTGIV